MTLEIDRIYCMDCIEGMQQIGTASVRLYYHRSAVCYPGKPLSIARKITVEEQIFG